MLVFFFVMLDVEKYMLVLYACDSCVCSVMPDELGIHACMRYLRLIRHA